MNELPASEDVNDTADESDAELTPEELKVLEKVSGNFQNLKLQLLTFLVSIHIFCFPGEMHSTC